VHLVGFIIRIYYDAQSSECQIQAITLYAICNYQGGHIIGVVQFVKISDKKEGLTTPLCQQLIGV
jgi:hypothetical protein